MENCEVVVVMVPFLAQGHLNPLLRLSHLLSTYTLPVHIVTTTTHSRQAKLRIHDWDPISTTNIHYHEYQIPQFESPPPDPNASTRFPSHLIPSFKASFHLRKPFAELLATISPTAKRVIVIHDFMMSAVVQDVVSFENTESYVFHIASAFTTFMYFWEGKGRPSLDDAEANMQLMKIPAVKDAIPADFLESVVMSNFVCNTFSSGNLHNTSKVIEHKFIDFLAKEGICGSSKQWAMGPFNPVAIIDDENPKKRHKVLEWLDKQTKNSVIYVSFGTATSLSDKQIQELAIGLENSEHNFIWVLRDADKGDIFEGDIRRIELPKGFEARVEGKGLVVREWAPQLEILGHPATGGFMTHCGWNSIMESITMGVPMAAWPMHSDQPRNATFITKVINIGISVRDWEDDHEVVTSSRIEKSIKNLMGSDEMRKRIDKLGEDFRRSVKKGGVTRMEIDSFVAHITR